MVKLNYGGEAEIKLKAEHKLGPGCGHTFCATE